MQMVMVRMIIRVVEVMMMVVHGGNVADDKEGGCGGDGGDGGGGSDTNDKHKECAFGFFHSHSLSLLGGDHFNSDVNNYFTMYISYLVVRVLVTEAGEGGVVSITDLLTRSCLSHLWRTPC